MGDDYTRIEDCETSFEYRSYQVGLLRVEDAAGGPSGPHGPAGNAWQWNAYGGEWHLMAGEEPTRDAASDRAMEWIRGNADETMTFLMSSGGR